MHLYLSIKSLSRRRWKVFLWPHFCHDLSYNLLKPVSSSLRRCSWLKWLGFNTQDVWTKEKLYFRFKLVEFYSFGIWKKCNFSVLNHSVITHKPDGSVRSGRSTFSLGLLRSLFFYSLIFTRLFLFSEKKKTNKPWYESDNEGERERKESTQVTAWACTDEKTKQKVNRNFLFFFPGWISLGLLIK